MPWAPVLTTSYLFKYPVIVTQPGNLQPDSRNDVSTAQLCFIDTVADQLGWAAKATMAANRRNLSVMDLTQNSVTGATPAVSRLAQQN